MPGWRMEDSAVARAVGDQWYDSGRSLILIVPSAVTNGQSRNVLINQAHHEFPQLTASEPRPVQWDERLATKP